MSVPVLKTNSRWDTKKGLLVYSIDIFGMSLLFVSILLAPKMISLTMGWILLFVPVTLFVIIWLFRRSYFCLFFSQKMNIVFSLDLKDKQKSTLKSYKETLRELNRKLIENNLEKYIKVIEKPEDMKFENKEAAEAKAKLGLYGSTLLIWGDIMELSKKYKLFFSYLFGYPGKEKDYYKSIFTNHIDKAMINRLWKYGGPNSAEFLADNLLQVSLYIIGSTAISFGRFDIGAKLFEIVRNDFKTMNILRQKNLNQFIMEVDETLIFAYFDFLKIYENFVFPKEYDNNKSDYEKIKFFADKILEINYDRKANYWAHIDLALYYEQKGEREESKKENYNAEKIHPSKQNSHILNKAYYAIAEYDFPVAIQLYEELLGFNFDTNFPRLRSFLINKGKKYNNLGFYFFEIFIAHCFDPKDPRYSKREFKKLIKRMERDKDNSKYQILILKAKELMIQ